MSESENLIPKSFKFNSVMIDRMNAIRVEKGFNSNVATLAHCLDEVYGKMIRNERRVKTVGTVDDKLSVEEKRQQRLEEKCRRIATTLEGKLVPSGDTFICEFYTYARTTRYLQRIPLMSLTEDLIANQYFPSKEIVDQLRQEGKVDYQLD